MVSIGWAVIREHGLRMPTVTLARRKNSISTFTTLKMRLELE